MKTNGQGVLHWVWLLALVSAFAVMAAWVAARWLNESGSRAQAEHDRWLAFVEQYERDMAPAPGRAELVPVPDLITHPERYDGKRVILSGIWIGGFEESRLDLQNSAQNFYIWVEPDWTKIDEPLGDSSEQNTVQKKLKFDRNGSVSVKIVAEGTFRFRRVEQLDGFGHMGVSEGLFHFDRLFLYEDVYGR